MAGTDDLRWYLVQSRGRNRRGRRQGVAQGQQPGEGQPNPQTPAAVAAQQAALSSMSQQMAAQKSSMLNSMPTAAPAGYPQYPNHGQQARSQMYPGPAYYQPKTHTPPLSDPLGASVRSTMPNNLPVHPDVKLKKLPFFDDLGDLLKPSTLMPTGTARMQEQSFVFHLTPTQANDMAYNRDVSGGKTDYSVQVQMRFCLLETSCEQEDFFPPGIAVKVNGKPCALPNPIPTNRPGVEPKRPPRPVNISTLVRISPTVANHVHVTWAAEYGRGYVIALNLVRKLSSTQLLHRLKIRGIRPAEYTTGLIKEKLREDIDGEIATTSLRVSLMCPLGKMRMSIPCRPTSCTHLQCFDANLYLQMNERKPTWTCPVCDKPGLFDTLVIDGYFQEVLSSSILTFDSNEIQLHQDGSWSVSTLKKEEKDDDPPPVKSRGGPPVVAATVEIADDVMSDGEEKEASEGAEKPAPPQKMISVDLTLSDESGDESPPPAPAKTNGPSSFTPSKTPEVTSNTGSLGVTPGYMSPNIITLDSPSPPSSPAHTPAPATSALPPFFDLDNEL